MPLLALFWALFGTSWGFVGVSCGSPAAWVLFWALLGASWAPPGSLLVPLRALLGLGPVVFGPVLALLASLGSLLGLSWACLGSLLGLSWFSLVASMLYFASSKAVTLRKPKTCILHVL